MPRRILLTSNGFTTDSMNQAFVQLLEHRAKEKKPSSNRQVEDLVTVYIPDAAIQEGARLQDCENDIKQQLQRFGLKDVRVLEVARATKEETGLALAGADVVYAECGNTFYLHYHMRRCGFLQMFPSFADQGVVYVGSSAGSIVAGPTAGIALWKGWDDPSVVPRDNPPNYESMNITEGVSIFPHFSSQWTGLVETNSATLGHELVTLTDYQAYMVHGDQKCVV
mmetsp:Transcript_12960/g.24702  ORF Transcript_12960/g.24702 Transcript_12960/m.24702 type:complete len:224 (+) Transcript_12960:217-888(+)